jgi:hypothetical protein
MSILDRNKLSLRVLFCVVFFADLEASQYLPWKREALEDCFWDAICNRVSAKYIGNEMSICLLVLDLTRWDLAGFPWDWLVRESLEQLNFVLVSFRASI